MTDQRLEELIAEFRSRAEPLTVEVLRRSDAVAAAAAAAQWVASLGADSLVVADELMERAPGFVDEVSRFDLQVTAPTPPNVMRDAPAGASLALLAIAETGSTLLAEPTLDDRSIGMLCLAQLIVCPTQSLVASLDDAVPELRRIALKPGGSFSTLITGPSRTADIERVLTVGVQGPGKVMILFVDDLS